MNYGRAIREKWLLEEDAVFLNHGSYGATPRVVLDAQSQWRARLERQPVRFMARELPVHLRATAAALGDFIGADGDDLALIDNATSGVNAVLRSLDLGPGDRVVTTNHAYNAIYQTLVYICKRTGAELVVADLPFPCPGEDAVVAALATAIEPGARLAVLDHIASSTALVFPIERLVALCRERGIPVLVDGAHAPGMVALNLEHLGADWYTGNCHKWLCAPKGCGFLWTRRDRQAVTHPLTISHGYGQGYIAEFDWTGTRDPSAWLALSAALDFHREHNSEQIRTHNHALALWAAEKLNRAWGGTLTAPESMLGSMVSIDLPPVHSPATLHDDLWDHHRIEVPVFPFGCRYWLRISAQIYNEPAEYALLAGAVDSYRS